MLSKGYIGFLAHMVSKVKLGLSIDDTLVVWEFPNVFLKELPKLAPKQEVKLSIELALNITPILKASYKMALAELQELKKQLWELLVINRPSHSL